MPTDYRRLPSVDRLLQQPAVQQAVREFSRPITLAAARRVLEEARSTVGQGVAPPAIEELSEATARNAAAQARPGLRPVINATGVVIHTNLGRAPLSAETVAAMAEVAAAYSNLEYDLAEGERGSRFAHLERTLAELTGAEAGLAVNNNAAAVLLCLTGLAKGREVIVSRGQAVEIGGGFRIPDVMRQSGARLVEVGTTNRTYASDYRAAVTSRTGLLLRVHTSNFRVVGFTESTPLEDMVALGREYGIPVLDDLGSGSLLDTSVHGLAPEPMVQESVAAGADLTCFSGDKLLGGPQAGIIVGSRSMVERLKRHPLARALRLDKATIAGLAATLLHYRRQEALEKVPVWRMISMPLERIEARARQWAEALATSGITATAVPSRSAIGGGSLPEETLATWCLALASRRPNVLAATLRRPPLDLWPVVSRVEHGSVLLDPRTVLPDQDEALLAAVRWATAAAAGG